METPGELYDKISILEIRLEKHIDVKACVDINDKLNLLRADVARWDGPTRLLTPTHKLRATPMRDFAHLTPDALVVSLKRINTEMWDNEDWRDGLMQRPVGETSEDLHHADRKEQRLNQDRTALLDAINAKWAKGERP